MSNVVRERWLSHLCDMVDVHTVDDSSMVQLKYNDTGKTLAMHTHTLIHRQRRTDWTKGCYSELYLESDLQTNSTLMEHVWCSLVVYLWDIALFSALSVQLLCSNLYLWLGNLIGQVWEHTINISKLNKTTIMKACLKPYYSSYRIVKFNLLVILWTDARYTR